METYRILVTGGAGYIGSVLCRLLLEAGQEVVAYDSLLFGDEGIQELYDNKNFEFIKGDVGDENLLRSVMNGCDVVVHLAAIVGDPACKLFPDEATRVNKYSSETVLRIAGESGVGRFIFASTCSNYGVQENGESAMDEFSLLTPQSHYAKLKVGFEQHLMQSDYPGSWTILRFATVYGLSPRARFDLTVNHFTRDMTLGIPLEIFGEGQWRPYCHVMDLARSVLEVLKREAVEMQGKIYNVGDSNENYTKRQIVDAIQSHAPDAEVNFISSNGGDLRDYRVDFGRIASELDFSVAMRLPDGITELRQALEDGIFEDPFAKKYQNC